MEANLVAQLTMPCTHVSSAAALDWESRHDSLRRSRGQVARWQGLLTLATKHV